MYLSDVKEPEAVTTSQAIASGMDGACYIWGRAELTLKNGPKVSIPVYRSPNGVWWWSDQQGAASGDELHGDWADVLTEWTGDENLVAVEWRLFANEYSEGFAAFY